MSNNNMTHINYKNVKERMTETNKGFWKVQLIHKLTTKLSMRYNPKDFITLKTIKKPPQKLPSFISFEHSGSSKKIKKYVQKNNSCPKLTEKDFFITVNKKKNENEKIENEKMKTLYNKIYGKFNYEPFLYNELQFLYLLKEKNLRPRKFKEVVKDSIALKEYINYVSNLQRMKDANNMTDSCVNNRARTIIYQKNLSSGFMNSNYDDYKNDFSFFNDNKIKNINENKYMNLNLKCSSMKNMRRNNQITIKSNSNILLNNKNKINLPKIKSNVKIKNFKINNILS
jgi:hypothetical protein